MVFDKLKNLFNAGVKDGLPGKAVVQSSSMPSPAASMYNVSMWIDVYVDGWAPYRLEHECFVRAGKHPWPGETLPVVVDRKNPKRVDIQWDQVRTVDEEMAAGKPGLFPGQVDAATVLGASPAGGIDLAALLSGAGPANVHVSDQAVDMGAGGSGQVIDLRGTPAGDQIRAALAARGINLPVRPDAAAADSPPAGGDRLSQLERLAALRDAGVLTPAEFDAEKDRILRG
ncbi:MAG: SHOCT domain-containing protein [Dehalococcoidia bacterium]